MLSEAELNVAIEKLAPYLTEAQKTELNEHVIAQNYKKGEYIYRGGEESVYLVCMVKGRAKLEKLGIGGRNQIMRMFSPGDFFGYRSYFANQDHITEAVAIERTTIALVPMKMIEKFCLQNPALAMYFIRDLSVDLGESDKRTVNLTQKHIRGRLADSIVFLIDKYGFESDGETINVRMSREDLAALSNMTTSNAIRTLATFVAEEIITVEGRVLRVINREKLRRINVNG